MADRLSKSDWQRQQQALTRAGGYAANKGVTGLSRDAAAAMKRLASGSNSKPTTATKKHHTIELDVAGQCLSEAYYRSDGKGSGTLFVTFTRTGDDYVYYDVPKETALQLDGGEAFNALIRDNFDYS
jgi:hypothetical protein